MAEIEVEVDLALCELHGQCIIAAPDIFRWAGDELSYDTPVAAELADALEDAVDVCPVQAIHSRRTQ